MVLVQIDVLLLCFPIDVGGFVRYRSSFRHGEIRIDAFGLGTSVDINFHNRSS
jgi:hypothetical protein